LAQLLSLKNLVLTKTIHVKLSLSDIAAKQKNKIDDNRSPSKDTRYLEEKIILLEGAFDRNQRQLTSLMELLMEKNVITDEEFEALLKQPR
jgi:hypothetical protein